MGQKLISDTAPDREIARFFRVIAKSVAKQLCPLGYRFGIDEDAGPYAIHHVVDCDDFGGGLNQGQQKPEGELGKSNRLVAAHDRLGANVKN